MKRFARLALLYLLALAARPLVRRRRDSIAASLRRDSTRPDTVRRDSVRPDGEERR